MATILLSSGQVVGKLAYGPMLDTPKQTIFFAAVRLEAAAAGDLVVLRDAQYGQGLKQVFRITKIERNTLVDGIFFVHAERPHGDPAQTSLAPRWPLPIAPIDLLDEFGAAA